jgi:hypothetical protein
MSITVYFGEYGSPKVLRHRETASAQAARRHASARAT